MDPIFVLLSVLLALTYFEGAFFALFITQIKKPSIVWQLITIFLWPIMIPIMTYKVFKTYAPIIKEMQTNPMLQAFMGINQTNLMQNAIENDAQKESDTPNNL